MFFHPQGEQPLADAVIDFVSARVEQVLALQVDARSAEALAQPGREIERSGPPGKSAKKIFELGAKCGIGLGFAVRALELLNGFDERFRDVAAAIGAEAAAGVGPLGACYGM